MVSVLNKQEVAPGAEIQQVNRTGRKDFLIYNII
jgi:hypothetical protein